MSPKKRLNYKISRFVLRAPAVMQDGTTKPIESLVQGDEVLSKDEKIGRMEARRVVQVTRRTVGRVVRVTLTDPATQQSQTLTATEDHPFYVDGKGFTPVIDRWLQHEVT